MRALIAEARARAASVAADSEARIAELEEQVARPDLWDDQGAARRVTTELARLRDDVELVERLLETVSDLETLAELAREEGDASQEPEIVAVDGRADLVLGLVDVDRGAQPERMHHARHDGADVT